MESDPSLSEDLASFAALARRVSAEAGPLRGFFEPERDLTLARAPGRLDVMGGIADYSGSLVLELPIREGAFAAAQSADDGLVRVVSIAPSGEGAVRATEIPVDELSGGSARARAWFSRSEGTAWAAYVAGALVALVEAGHALGGARLLVASSVPEGKGVASSASVTVASLAAASAALGFPFEPVALALACQKVENLVVGAPSGVMDPMTAVLGEEHRLLELLCQPAVVQGQLEVPEGARFFGIDSGVRHAVTGSDYGAVRIGAFMGQRILAVRDPKLAGYLANVTVDELGHHLGALPERLRGDEFLARYGGTTDSVTHVDPETTYPVRAATAHPVLEHARVRAFAALLRGPLTDGALGELGRLMGESHASYSACGLGSDGTDRLVELVREAGPDVGLFGAKITGGGSGGTVAVLARSGADSDAAVERVARAYAKETGRVPYVFRGSSPGAARFGVRVAQALRR